MKIDSLREWISHDRNDIQVAERENMMFERAKVDLEDRINYNNEKIRQWKIQIAKLEHQIAEIEGPDENEGREE